VVTGSKDSLMTAVVGRGPAPRALSAVELGIMRDLGYTIAPGSGGATLMFVGVLFLRRLRKSVPQRLAEPARPTGRPVPFRHNEGSNDRHLTRGAPFN
jgi:hypothetical protein